MKYYAVIDTNVLVSAMLKWNSVPGFHLTKEIVDDVLENLELRGISVEAETIDILLPDPKDRVFYEVVLEERKAEEAYLVTGNIKHFPVKTFIVTPRKMLDIVFSETESE